METNTSALSVKADPRGNLIVSVHETFSTARLTRTDLLCRPRLTRFLREQDHPFGYREEYSFGPKAEMGGANAFNDISAQMSAAARSFSEASRSIRERVEAQAARHAEPEPIQIETIGSQPVPYLVVNGLRWRAGSRSTVERDDDDVRHVLLLDELIGLPCHGHSSGGIDVIGFVPGTDLVELNVRKTFSSRGTAGWYSLSTGERMPTAKVRRMTSAAPEFAAV